MQPGKENELLRYDGLSQRGAGCRGSALVWREGSTASVTVSAFFLVRSIVRGCEPPISSFRYAPWWIDVRSTLHIYLFHKIDWLIAVRKSSIRRVLYQIRHADEEADIKIVNPKQT